MSAEVEQTSGAKSIGDLSHGLEGLLDEGDGSEIGWKYQQSQSEASWSTKLGRQVSEVVGDWLEGGRRGGGSILRADNQSSGEKQRKSPVSWWQKIRPKN